MRTNPPRMAWLLHDPERNKNKRKNKKESNMKIKNMIYTAVTMVCLTASLGLSSCSDDEFLYRDQARVRLVGPENYTAGSDSLTFSFATSSSDVEEKVMNVEVVVMGLAADHDRTASVTADENKTTASSSEFEARRLAPCSPVHEVSPSA